MLSESKRPSVLTVSLVLLIVVSRPVCSKRIFALCRPGEEFWSTEKSACHPCTKCAPAFTLSPCAVHKDAACGPLSALELDWSFLSTRRKSEMGPQTTDAVISKMLWRFPELEEQQQKSPEVDDKVDCDERTKTTRDPNDQDGFPIADHLQESIVDSGQRRTSGEAGILWDWQTGALVLAICACIVFFLVAGCSALIYVRQWRRMKRNFEPDTVCAIAMVRNRRKTGDDAKYFKMRDDIFRVILARSTGPRMSRLTSNSWPVRPATTMPSVIISRELMKIHYSRMYTVALVLVKPFFTGLEEISARLNLMMKAELSELTAGGPKNPGDPKIRCQYLENLLDRNRETPAVGAGWPETSGNLYIDERETPRSKRVQIARIHRNIEKVLSNKANRG